MRSKTRKTIHIHARSIVIIVGLSLIIMILGWFCVDESRHYYWNDPVTSEIVDKEAHSYTETHYLSTDPPQYYYTYETDYYIYLDNGHKESVNHDQYDSYQVGMEYTYQVLHRDWKPGMNRDVPIPIWIYIVPVFFLLFALIFAQYPVMVKRQKEMNQWIETGDLTVEDD